MKLVSTPRFAPETVPPPRASADPKPRAKLRLPLWAHQMSLPLAFLAYLLLDVTLRYLYDEVGAIPASAFPPWLFSACWALVLTCAGALMPRLWRRIWFGVTFFVFAAECVVHAALYKLTGTFFSFAAMAFAGDGAKFFSFAYLNIDTAEWIWLAVCLVLMVLAILLAPDRRPERPAASAPALLLVLAGLTILMAQRALYIDVTRDKLTWDAKSKESVFAESYSRIERTNDCMLVSGLYEFTFRSALSTYLPSNFISHEEHTALDDWYAAHPKKTDSPYAGALEGQNLIVVLMESVDTWMVTPAYMPNLYAALQESVQFTDYYAPMYISAATFNSEFAVNTGLAAPPVGISNNAYATYSFPYSMAHLFRSAGYTANSFHVGKPDVYNRGNVHLNFGFEAYHSAKDMGVTNVFRDSQLVRAHEMYAPEGPFYSFLLTYSVHGPHNGEMWGAIEPHLEQANQTIDFDGMDFPTDLDREEYKCAIAQAMETDEFIGKFMQQLEADGRAEDTTVIFLADHYAKYMTNAEFVMQLKGAPNRDLLTRVPFGIWSKKLEPQVVSTPVSITDVAPTIASLFALDVDLRYYTGNDMFSSDAGIVPFIEGHWISADTYYDGRDYYAVERVAPAPEPDAEGQENPPLPYPRPETDVVLTKLKDPPPGAQETTDAVYTRMQTAWRTLQSDYFAYLTEKK